MRNRFFLHSVPLILLLLLTACGPRPETVTADIPKPAPPLTEASEPDLASQTDALIQAYQNGEVTLDAVLVFQAEHPQISLSYEVTLAGQSVPNDISVLVLNSEAEVAALTECRDAFPALSSIDMTAVPLPAERLREILSDFPEGSVAYSVSLFGKSHSVDAEEIAVPEITGENLDELIGVLDLFPRLKTIDLHSSDGSCSLTFPELNRLAEAAPEAMLRFDFELFGITVSSEADHLEFIKTDIGDDGAELLTEVFPFMPNLNYVLLDSCGIANARCAALREAFPEKGIVWRIRFERLYTSFLTDTEVLVCNGLDDNDIKKLVYFNNVKYLDLGHSTFSSVDFLVHMPGLQVAILALNHVSDISPIVNCPELEYLELFSTDIKDISPLSALVKLEHLNISNMGGITDISCLYGLTNLKRLRCTWNSRITLEQRNEIRSRLPDCVIEFGEDGDMDPTGGTWRRNKDGSYAERYALLREQMGY